MDNKKEEGVGIPTGEVEILYFVESGRFNQSNLGPFNSYQDAEACIVGIANKGDKYTSGYYKIEKWFLLKEIE